MEPEFRAVIVLRDIEECDYEQIAAILEVPVGTIKSAASSGAIRVTGDLLQERPGISSRALASGDVAPRILRGFE